MKMKEVGVKKLVWTVVAGLAMSFAAGRVVGQAAPPVVSPATAEAQRVAEPQAPTPQEQSTQAMVPSIAFPAVDPKNFTATTPTRDEVNSFLTALWGYDPNRIWSVAAILKTKAPGVAKVVVFLADKSKTGKPSQTVFFTTPDGKHAIADNVMEFGAKPFADTRKVLQERADGPAEGAAGKELMLVEFMDLQCPNCKAAQETVSNLAADFPQARIVMENLPLTSVHPFAMRAATEGVCVRKAKGDAAFFVYAKKVYDKQEALTADGAEATLGAAVTAAGADPKAIAACADTQAAKDEVKASATLASDLGVEQTPVLAINGHMLALGGIPYETLKRIIAFQAGQDGVVVHVQPSLTTLK